MKSGQSPSRNSNHEEGITPAWPQPDRRLLGNGLTVLVSELPHLHTAAIGLYVRAGSRYESRQESGLSHLVEHVLFRGCERYPSVGELNEAIEDVAVEVGGSTGREFCAYEAVLDPRHVRALLDVMGAMFTAPSFIDVDLERAIILEELRDEVDERGVDIDVDNVAKAALFPGDPLGRKIGGDTRRLETFDSAACRAWFDTHYGGENLVLVVAGPVVAEEVFDWSARFLGELPRGTRKTTQAATPRADLPALEYVSQPGSQSDVHLMWHLPPVDHPDFPALVVAYRLLEDGASARLRRRLVDERALAYRAGASLETYEGVSMFTIEASTAHENVRDVVEEALAVIGSLATDPVGAPEWSRWQSRAMFDVGSGLDHPSYICSSLGLDALLQGHDTPLHRLNRALETTPEQLRDAVARYLTGDRMQLSVIGDLEPLERAALRRIVHRCRA
jgi:predicted Zn-dependent peptidase